MFRGDGSANLSAIAPPKMVLPMSLQLSSGTDVKPTLRSCPPEFSLSTPIVANDLSRSPPRSAMTAMCAMGPQAGVDVEQSVGGRVGHSKVADPHYRNRRSPFDRMSQMENTEIRASDLADSGDQVRRLREMLSSRRAFRRSFRVPTIGSC